MTWISNFCIAPECPSC